MNLGRIEVILILVVLASLGWIGFGMIKGGKHAELCAPLPLSQDVKAYIDSKLAASSSGQCGDIPKVVGKIADLELKMGAVEVYRQNHAQLEKKHAELAQVLEATRERGQAVLNQARAGEIRRLKSEVAAMCANGAPAGGNGNSRTRTPPAEDKTGAGSEGE